ncbi:MAG: RNA methyltransferase [Bacteroidota bacterium]|nr:RNA methyltransferase [Bacteroidota bacterium]
MAVPDALLQSLQSVKGFDRKTFEAVHASDEKITSIRYNLQKPIPQADWEELPIPWCPQGRYLSSRPSFTLDPLFHAGAYYVQEPSSMFLWQVLKETIGTDTQRRVLDLCAAPGGKSGLLANYCKDGLVVANEVIKSRAAILVENMTKWGADQVVITNNDPSHFAQLPGFFDLMVVDAPCSGSGLFRKDPSAIEEWSEENVQLCSQRQQRILADILPALQEEGILVYATCSFSPEEDEAIADWLVTEMNMESVRISTVPEWGIIETESPRKQAFGYRFFPDKVKGEGFFIAVFQKKATPSLHRYREINLLALSGTESQMINDIISIPETHALFKQGESIRTFARQYWKELQVLAKSLYIKKAGIDLGTFKGKDLIPAHDLAMSVLPKENFPVISLSREEALSYLRRSELKVENTTKGWNLFSYQTLPLGWVKVLPNRINNYYPSEWRILKE